MGKRQALAEYHRGSILAAAERLFAEKGTEGTTMDDIAREAEYSKATLYVYFQSKEEIVGAILLNGLAMLKKRVGQAIDSCEDWYAAYDAACQAVLEFYAANPTAYEAVMAGGAGAMEARGDRDVRRAIRELCQELGRFLEKGKAAGVVLEGQNDMEMVMLFWASVSGMIRIADGSGGVFLEQMGKTREEFLKDGFRLILRAITGK